jgi:hypothetical protein
MAIRDFSVGPSGGLRHAEAHEVPNLMAIAGPNGAGKSNLLEAIRQQRGTFLEPGSELLYVGPHRTWRSSNISRVAAYGFSADSYLDVLKGDALPSYQYGIPGNLQMLQGTARLASSADDAQAYIKTSIIRLFDKRRALVTERWETNNGEVLRGSVPDLFEPFHRLVATLLPHLDWIKVDDSQTENIRCLFRPKGDPTLEFDIDDLSSGEKSAIALFLPFIEKQAMALVPGDGPQPEANDTVPLTVLIDEPEIHLHPLLQLNVLEYMRVLARDNEAQFLFTCHSPTMLDALADDELWLLSPASLGQDNQLVRLTNNREHLEVARMLTGATHLLTRGKPIVFVEGEPDVGSAVTDERMMRLLMPHTNHWAIVPTREKRGVIDATERLRGSELAMPGQPVFGLVDTDRDHATLPDYVIAWPVAMIENLLLEPAAILRVLTGFEAVTNLRTEDQVQDSLHTVATARREEEITLRVKASLPVGRIALDPGDLQDAQQAVNEAARAYMDRLGGLDLPQLATDAEEEVDEIISRGEMLERFHGKRMLHSFYEQHKVGSAGLSKPAFATKLAEACAASARVAALAIPALDQIRLFFPSELAARLRAIEEVVDQALQVERDALAALCDAEHELWLQRAPRAEGREHLRQRVFNLAHHLEPEDRQTITMEASRIGTA